MLTARWIAPCSALAGLCAALMLGLVSCRDSASSPSAAAGERGAALLSIDGSRRPPAPTIALYATAGPNLPPASLALAVYVPDRPNSFYRGSRYDSSGIVAQAVFNGHRYFAVPPSSPAPEAGVIEEFDPVSPPGYDDAHVGQAFVKIGVGLLQRVEESKYRPDKSYTILRTSPWRIIQRDDSIEFSQELVDVRGFAYEYRKTITISLDPPSFTIERRIHNTGTKIIRTRHVCYPYVRLDDAAVGPGYHVGFNFQPTPVPANSLAGRAEIRGRDLWLLAPPAAIPTPESLWAVLTGYAATSESKEIRVSATLTPAQLAILPDYGLSQLTVAATAASVSPQTSVDIVLKPDDLKFWNTRFVLELRPR